MKNYKHFIVLVVLLLVVTGGLGFAVVKNRTSWEDSSNNQKIAAKEFIGQKLPELSLTGVNEEAYSSNATLGKPTIVMEWASWCPHCQAMMPTMNKMYAKYKNDVNFLFINATGSRNGEETKAKASNYVAEKGFDFPYYYDNGMAAATALEIDSVPTFFYVDSDGVVKDVTVSEMKESKMDQKINALIEKPNHHKK